MKRFNLTEKHIKLLTKAYVSWEDCEFGAPAIDCKRPYGNSDVYVDMSEILGDVIECPSCGYKISSLTDEELDKLHGQTRDALQIILKTKSFEPGIYVCSDYGNDWRKE